MKEKGNRDIPSGLIGFSCILITHVVFLGGGNLKKMPEKNKNVESGLKSETIGWFSLRVGAHDVIDPVEEFTHFDVDSGVVGKGTPLTPRHQAMNFSETHQGAAGVSLSNTMEGVLAGVYTDVFFHLPRSLRCMRLCLHPYIRHTTSCSWSCQDRLYHSPRHSLWVHPSTADGWALLLEDRRAY